MTVKELIVALQKLPDQDLPVCVNESGHGYDWSEIVTGVYEGSIGGPTKFFNEENPDPTLRVVHISSWDPS